MSNLTKKDWTLLAIAAARGEPVSPLQLQKALFLLGQKLPSEVQHDFYQFMPYNYGPFDASIYSDADALSAENLIAIRTVPGRSWAEYVATAEGLARAAELSKQVSPVACKYLEDVVQWVRSQSFAQLLRAIYAAYPDYAVNSVFTD